LKTVLVRQGDVVKKGALLASLDSVVAQSHVREASVTFEIARKEAQRSSALVQSGALPSSALADTQAALTSARTALDVARETAKGSRLLAPLDGIVFARLAEPGEAIGAGAPVIALDDVATYIVKLSVTLRDADRARAASAITLVSATGAPLGPAKVTSIATVPTAASGLYDIELSPRGVLPHVGELVTARFEVPAQAGVLRVPFDAVVHGHQGAEVFVVEQATAGAVVHRRLIQIDRTESSDVIVRTGLRAGERIVREGAAFLRDGDAVEIAD
jgi:RND family efflux transporter MFP subunit